ncbi:MAG: Gfo/Idh/MocA family oxidoreductase [Anaerolineales bacterium]|nr:Gfo/Idh/MocA family oxidoreductase [Anaerolineales bacterium]
MKFLIAGFGSIGRRHFHNLKTLGEKDILFYRTRSGSLPDEELDGFVVENDLAAALAHKPDAVVVANPTALHLDVAIPAAEAGCHLLLEKPISHSLDRVAELQAALVAGGGGALVGFQYRFHPGLQQAAEVLASGELGEPLSARAHWGEYLPGWHPWEDYRQGYSARSDLGGGVVLTLCHPFDYLRWLLGDVGSLWAITRRSGQLDIEVEDQAEVGLEMANGALASVQLNYLQRPAAHWLEVVCSEGSLHWDATNGLLRVQPASGGSREFPAPAGFDRNDMFLDEIRHFTAVARGEAAPLCTLEDGIQAQRIVEAVHRSAAEGRRVELV